MYAIMGATGQTGGAALRELRRLGAGVRALVRDPSRGAALRADGVETVVADADDVDALTRAFTGVEGAYVMLPPHLQADDAIAAGLRTARAVAEAIDRAGLKHVVALSSGGAHLAQGTGVIRTLHDFEAELRRTRTEVTFIRASDFMENWAFAVPAALEAGVMPSGRVPFDKPMLTVSALDIGRLAARRLLDPGEEWILNLTGPADYSPNDLAAAFATAVGRPVQIVPLPREALLPAFLEAGIGPDYARGLVEVYDGLNAGLIDFEPGVGVLVRGEVSLVEAVRAMVAGR
jgi:uncharacterized protein YbjT (DUF2867 family)